MSEHRYTVGTPIGYEFESFPWQADGEIAEQLPDPSPEEGEPQYVISLMAGKARMTVNESWIYPLGGARLRAYQRGRAPLTGCLCCGRETMTPAADLCGDCFLRGHKPGGPCELEAGQ